MRCPGRAVEEVVLSASEGQCDVLMVLSVDDNMCSSLEHCAETQSEKQSEGFSFYVIV